VNPFAILAALGLIGVGAAVFAGKGSKPKDCGRLEMTPAIASRVLAKMPELTADLLPSTPAVVFLDRLARECFPSCDFGPETIATLVGGGPAGEDISWKDHRAQFVGQTLGQMQAKENGLTLDGAAALTGPGTIDSLFSEAFARLPAMETAPAPQGNGMETAPAPQGEGTYVGDPRGYTAWPGQAVIPTQRAFGQTLSVLGYDVGDFTAPSYSVIGKQTFIEVGDFQLDANRFKSYYGADWYPTLTVDRLLGPSTIAALVGLVDRVDEIDWQASLDQIPKAPPPKTTGGSGKARLWNMLESLSELTTTQRMFIMLTAYGESGGGFRPTAHNDSASEVAASAAAWDNNPTLAVKLVNCGYGGKQAWAIGSGGYGGRLVPYFGNDMLRAGLTCDPGLLFEPNHSLLSSLITAYYMQQTKQWKASEKTVKNLRAGYYGLAHIKWPPEKRIAKYRRHAEAVGFDASFVDEPITTFPPPSKAKAMLARLKNLNA